jgi:D-xylose transport system substrate-binding protein
MQRIYNFNEGNGISMKTKSVFKITIIISAVLLLILLFPGCGRVIKIGLSFSDYSTTERWPIESGQMAKLISDRGYQAIIFVANHDPKLQNEQIEKMVLQKVDVIIIVAEDGVACAEAVDIAAAADIPCIAYDRLIMSDKLSAYISFDNMEVGRQQAEGVLKVRNRGNFVLLGGSPTDNNAVIFRSGQMEKIKPLIDSGSIRIVADQWVQNWDQEKARRIMENILKDQEDKVDAVIASNDGIALGAIQALKKRKLAGIVPISGQDATVAGCKSIVSGELTVTVLKDSRLLTPLTVDMAIKFARKEKVDDLVSFDLSSLTLNENLKGKVPCKFLPVIQINKTNIYDVMIKSGFKKYDEIYSDIPENKRPPRI